MTSVRHLRALQAFDAAAARSSISRAAEDLGVTHGAISRQIKQLEQYLDVVLLRRLHDGVELTEAGARLHLATQDAFAALDQGIKATKRTVRRRSVTISLSSSLAIKWLVPRLQDFRERHPDISVYLDTDDQFVDFGQSDVDVALRFGSTQSNDLYSDRLLEERLVVAAAPQLVPEGSIAAENIENLPLLHDQFHPDWDRWAQAAGLREPSIQSKSFAYPDSAVLLAAALDGQGAVLVRHMLVADDIKAGRLISLSAIVVEQENALYFVCRDGDQFTPSISALYSWLVEAAACLASN